MASIKFDNVELVDSTHITRYAKHESSPERDINLLQIADDNGSAIVSIRYGAKTINLAGILTAASPALLEAEIDTFKEVFSRENKYLDIDWSGGTRRYVATCQKHEFDRDHFHLLFVPWTAQFIVPSGTGEDTSETVLISPAAAITAGDYTDTLTFEGSSEPKPRFIITMTDPYAAPVGISLENTDNGEKIIVPFDSLAAADVIEIDCRLKEVRLNGVASKFYGQFPNFIIGDNDIELKIGDILDQYCDQSVWDDSGPYAYALNGIGAYLKVAESFMVTDTDKTYYQIASRLKKSLNAAGNLVVRIETDSNGAPSGSLVSGDATITINVATELTTAFAWLKKAMAAAVTLNANTKYWIVWDGSGINNEQAYITQSKSIIYSKGSGMYWGGGAWQTLYGDNFGFKLYYGGPAFADDATFECNYYKRFL